MGAGVLVGGGVWVAVGDGVGVSVGGGVGVGGGPSPHASNAPTASGSVSPTARNGRTLVAMPLSSARSPDSTPTSRWPRPEASRPGADDLPDQAVWHRDGVARRGVAGTDDERDLRDSRAEATSRGRVRAAAVNVGPRTPTRASSGAFHPAQPSDRPLATAADYPGDAITTSDDGPAPSPFTARIAKIYATTLLRSPTACAVVSDPLPATSIQLVPPSTLYR